MFLNPTEKNPIHVADWIELQILYSNYESFSLEELKSNIEVDGTLIDEEEPPEKPSYDLSEELVTFTEIEINRRAKILKGAYPFALSNGVLQASENPDLMPYIFCLLTADREYYDPHDHEPPKLFEHLVCQALSAYLNGDSVRFGSPRDTMAIGVNDALEELAKLTGNRKLKDGYPTNADDQDLGLDVAAWKNFPDRYWSKVELYMQCTTSPYWDRSMNKCNLDEWRGIIFWPFLPVKALAIPYVLSETEWERETCGLLFMDRLRIASVLEGQELPDSRYQWWEWCQKRIQESKQREN